MTLRTAGFITVQRKSDGTLGKRSDGGPFAAKENVTLLCHCAEDAKECHRFELQKLIERETA